MKANKSMVTLHEHLCDTALDNETYVIVNEGVDVPPLGISFDLPRESLPQSTKTLLNSVRRLHINTGHPPNSELERIVRLAGGSSIAQQACKGLRCTACAKDARTKLPRPGRVRGHVGEFNSTVWADIGSVKDKAGTTFDFIVMVDEGTDWTVCSLVEGHGASKLYDSVENHWINFAGPPDMLVADGERGFASQEFVSSLAKAGTMYVPTAAYAPWQKGKVERRTESIKSIIRKVVLLHGLSGAADMRMAGIEAASAINSRPGPTGVSPSMLLFGQRLKLYGELYSGGEPVGSHPDGQDPNGYLTRRFQIREASRRAYEKWHAKELVRRAVSARSRPLGAVSVGEVVFFYRNYPNAKSQKLQAQRGKYLGPGIVIGHQGGNIWVSYAGRCYLVALEHVRGLAPDESFGCKPLVKEGLTKLKEATKAQDYIDLTQQEVSAEELAAAAGQLAGNDHEADEDEVDQNHAPQAAPPAQELPHEHEPQAVAQQAEDVPIPDAAGDIDNKRALEEAAAAAPSGTWVPEGPADRPNWVKKARTETGSQVMIVQRKQGVMTDALRKKLLDREVPIDSIPKEHFDLYKEAEEKE